MIKLNKIYTRTGDDGTTGLGTGARVAKHTSRIHTIGAIDETNACIGLVRLHTRDAKFARLDAMLARIQNELFDIGADLAVPEQKTGKHKSALRLNDDQVARLERELDRLNEPIEPLTSFVLPGGTPAAAALHLARTATRRAERHLAGLAAMRDEHVNPPVLKYVNRLSDFLFVAARFANDEGRGDVVWVPGQTRDPG